MEKSNNHGWCFGPTALGVGFLLLLTAGCAKAADYELVIMLDEDGCPVEVADASESCAAAGERVEKNKACGTNGTDTLKWVTEPPGTEFRLFFDPFQAGPKHKSRQGEYSRKLDAGTPRKDSDQPAITYKYTVVVEDEACDPFDPRIVVRPR